VIAWSDRGTEAAPTLGAVRCQISDISGPNPQLHPLPNPLLCPRWR